MAPLGAACQRDPDACGRQTLKDVGSLTHIAVALTNAGWTTCQGRVHERCHIKFPRMARPSGSRHSRDRLVIEHEGVRWLFETALHRSDHHGSVAQFLASRTVAEGITCGNGLRGLDRDRRCRRDGARDCAFQGAGQRCTHWLHLAHRARRTRPEAHKQRMKRVRPDQQLQPTTECNAGHAVPSQQERRRAAAGIIGVAKIRFAQARW